MKNIGIAIHGGAGTILKSQMTDEKEIAYKEALKKALDAGYAMLDNGKSAMDAIEEAIIQLEDCPLFNAGKGSVFNSKGEHELDASIMNGANLKAGAAAAVKHIKNPIKLARLVLEKSEHVLLMGSGANEFADVFNLEKVPDEYFYDAYRFEQWNKMKGTDDFQLDHSKEKKKYFGTVGAVAMDQEGNLAAGTSTGGMTNKKYGRVGDSPIIGSGTYANNTSCAISCTGSGEYLMKAVTAYEVHARMHFQGMSIQEASFIAINESLTHIGGDGGLIGIDYLGNIVMPFNCEGMYRAFKTSREEGVYIYK